METVSLDGNEAGTLICENIFLKQPVVYDNIGMLIAKLFVDRKTEDKHENIGEGHFYIIGGNGYLAIYIYKTLIASNEIEKILVSVGQRIAFDHKCSKFDHKVFSGEVHGRLRA